MRMSRMAGATALLAGVAIASMGAANLAGASGTRVPALAKAAPPGNNGTVKIDDTPLIDGTGADHGNEPHVTCTFAVSFWGFDAGTQTAKVMFTAQPPSGPFTPVSPTVGPGTLSFPGLGPGGTLDASQEYQLNVNGLTANPQQGYHIKLTVDVTGSQGADEKHKVFWYQPCTPVTTTTTTVPVTTTTVPVTTTTVPVTTTTLGPTGGTAPLESTTTTVPATTTTLGPTGGTTPLESTTTLGPTAGTAPLQSAPTALGAAAGGPASSSTETAAGAPASSGRSALVFTGPEVGAAENSLPKGAGTDLGSFVPISSSGGLLPPLSMLVGGLMLSLAGTLALRRKQQLS